MKLLKTIFHKTRRVFAKLWLGNMHVTQIAITGSQGKTAVSQGLCAMLKTLRPAVVTDTNLDTIYNVPITALKIRPYHHFAIFELGIDKLNEMDFHLDIVKPYIAVVTGVSPVHTDEAHMKSFENAINEKSKLVKALTESGYAVMNFSDKNVREMSKITKAKLFWYGSKADFEKNKLSNYVCYSDVVVTTDGTNFVLYDKSESKEIKIKTKLIGTFHAANICAIYCILKVLNPYFIENFDKGVYDLLAPLAGRMNMQMGPNDTLILNDSLRANPTSTAAGLETFANIEYKKGRKVVILADMGELEKPEEEHKKIGKLIAKLPVDMVVCAGKMQKFVAIEAAKNKKIEVHYYDTVGDAKKEIMLLTKQSDFIYLKGSKYSFVGQILEI